MNFINLLIQRILSPTPEFHAKIRNLMIVLVTVATLVEVIKPAFIPASWHEYIQFGIAVAGAFGIYAQTTSTNH